MDVKAAIDFVMKQEDSTLSGIITDDPTDMGGTTRFGLTAKYHPALVAQGFYTKNAVPTERAIPMAESAYQSDYAASLQLQAIKSRGVGTALLSFAVVEGTPTAVRVLQGVLNAVGYKLTVDGVMGNQTVNALNDALSLTPGSSVPFMQAWLEAEEKYFAGIVKLHPNQIKYIAGWDNRAEAVLKLV